MTKDEIKQKIDELKEQISDLEKEVEKVGDDGKKKYPVDGTTFYFLDACGRMECDSWGNRTPEVTKRMKLMFDSGEISLTREGIEEYAEVKQIERELYALADDNKEWDGENPHYFLYYSRKSFSCHVAYEYNSQENNPYFQSSESAEKAIETVDEERVIKWLTYKRKRPEV